MQEVPKKTYVRSQSTKTSQDQQQETVHRALQAKDAKILTTTSATTRTICLRQYQQQCTKHVST